jgi:hypothetical protein
MINKNQELLEYFKKSYENARRSFDIQFNDDKRTIAEKLASQTYRAGVTVYTHEMAYNDYCKSLSDYFIMVLSKSLNTVRPKKLDNNDIKQFSDYNDSIYEGITKSAIQYCDEWIAGHQKVPIGIRNEFKTGIISVLYKYKNDTKTKLELTISVYNYNPQNTLQRLKDNIIMVVISAFVGLLFGLIGGYLGSKLDNIIKFIMNQF